MRGSIVRRSVIAALLVLAALAAGAPTAGAESITDGADQDARDALRLLRYVPEDYRATCGVLDPAARFSGIAERAQYIQGGVGCFPEPGLYVTFTQFTDRDVAEDAFDSFLTSGDYFGDFPPDSDCGGDGTYDVRGREVGRWACYTMDPARVAPTGGAARGVELNWVDSRSAILGTAVRRDGDEQSLYDWWSGDGSGPLSSPTAEGIPPPLTAAEQRRVGRRLLRLVPKGFRASCAPLDVNRPDDVSSTEFETRVFIRAMVRCSPESGPDLVSYYAFSDAAHTDAYMTKLTNDVEFGTDDCPATSTYKVGRKRAGAYSCWFYGDPTNAAVIWGNDDLAVVGLAIRSDADSDELLRWWASSGGPVT
jgi:hypothetical protein